MAFSHAFVGLLDIEIADAFHVGIKNDGGGMVADHGAGAGEPAALFIGSYEALDGLEGILGFDEGLERVGAAVGVPHIAHSQGAGSIERGIEEGAFFFGAAFDPDKV